MVEEEEELSEERVSEGEVKVEVRDQGGGRSKWWCRAREAVLGG